MVHFARLPPAAAYRVLDEFVATGRATGDTASFYGRGNLKSVLGSWLRKTGPAVHVRTKILFCSASGNTATQRRYLTPSSAAPRGWVPFLTKCSSTRPTGAVGFRRRVGALPHQVGQSAWDVPRYGS
jgi:hypothetical protein